MTDSRQEFTLAQAIGAIGAQLSALDEKVDVAARHRAEADKRLDRIEERLTQTDHRLDHIENEAEVSVWGWIKRHWPILVALSVPAPTVLMLLTVGAFQVYGGSVMDFLREEIEKSEFNSEVLHQPKGMSYVRSPVYVEGVVEYVLVAGRTDFGESCEYETTIPIFTDDAGQVEQGDFEPRGRQLRDTIVRSEIELPVPEDLSPGHTRVVLNIHYRCGGKLVIYESDPVSFMLLPAP